MRAGLESLRRYLAPGPSRVLAAVAVADREAVMPFYEALFGRPADAVPMPVDAEWAVGATTLQVVEDPERAGRSLVTLATGDLDRWVGALRARGIAVGAPEPTSVGPYVRLDDPDGNRITLVQPAS
jgi:predicted enzyme related to lactoylglutathione lyase